MLKYSMTVENWLLKQHDVKIALTYSYSISVLTFDKHSLSSGRNDLSLSPDELSVSFTPLCSLSNTSETLARSSRTDFMAFCNWSALKSDAMAGQMWTSDTCKCLKSTGNQLMWIASFELSKNTIFVQFVLLTLSYIIPNIIRFCVLHNYTPTWTECVANTHR